MISKAKADYLRSLADAAGHIDPQLVVADAKNPASPLHDEFLWDVGSAAEAHWLETARSLIRFVKLETVISRQTIIAPYYVPDPSRPPRSRRYLELSRVAADVVLAKQAMDAELERIAAAIRRAQAMAAVLGMQQELEDLLADVSILKTTAEKRAEEKTRKKRKGKAKPRGRARGRPEVRA